MAAKKKKVLARSKAPKSAKSTQQAVEHDVDEVIAALQKRASKKTRDGMARYAIPSQRAFGVPVGEIRKLGKALGKSHALAEALWDSGHYEARMLATFIDDIALVTPKQMDRWCKDFDNWAICDTACFGFFDRSVHAYEKVAAWAKRKPEFEKRAGFALLASLALHDKRADNEVFLALLPLIEQGAHDERNFVKKAVSWALRGVGRRSIELNRASIEVAERLSRSTNAPARWVGKDALRELAGPAVRKRLAARAAAKRGIRDGGRTVQDPGPTHVVAARTRA
jgi:3-methyladenine DNA glycosylase AlkD